MIVDTISHSLAPNTQSTYMSGARSYVGFCWQFRFRPFPASEDNLCSFAVFLAERPLSYRTIKVYLFAVQHHSLMFGYPIRFVEMQYLFHVLRGIRRMQGSSLIRPPRAPITVSHLWIMFGFLSASQFSPHNKAMWKSVVLTAFFGLLRVSEFTCAPRSFDPACHLSPTDISFNRDYSMMYIRIKASKTDPFRVGITIRIAAIPNHQLCPVTAMRQYLRFRSNTQGPLYIFDNGAFVNRAFLVAFLQISLPGVSHINTHSFRIGGASAALSAGATDALIRAMGRWSSDCYHRYLRIPDHTISEFQYSISTARTTSTWEFD